MKLDLSYGVSIHGRKGKPMEKKRERHDQFLIFRVSNVDTILLQGAHSPSQALDTPAKNSSLNNAWPWLSQLRPLRT